MEAALREVHRGRPVGAERQPAFSWREEGVAPPAYDRRGPALRASGGGRARAGVVHGLDLAPGAPLWGASLGRHREYLPCRLFAEHADTVVAQGAGTSVHALDAHPPRRAVASVLVRARVVGPGRVAGLRVGVGDVWVTTDDRGEVETRVHAARVITVAIDARSLPACMATEAVQIDATRARRGRVRLGYGVDYCACHPCD